MACLVVRFRRPLNHLWYRNQQFGNENACSNLKGEKGILIHQEPMNEEPLHLDDPSTFYNHASYGMYNDTVSSRKLHLACIAA